MRARRRHPRPRAHQLGRRFALLAMAAMMTALVQVLPAAARPAMASGGAISLLSTSQWFEVIDPSTGVRAYHLVGEVRNDTDANVTNIQLKLNLYDSHGNPDATTPSVTTFSTVQVLAPAERSPFEAILYPAPSDYGSFTVSQPIAFAASAGQPDHGFVTAIDACANPDPTSPDCQDHLSGSVKNPTTAPPATEVAAVFTFYNGSGGIVGQDRTLVTNGTGGTSLSPGQTGHFALDRSGEPGWSTRAVLVEPDYPIDVNPSALEFGNQRTGTPSATEDVALINNGPDPVTIKNATASGDFTVTGTDCIVIQPSTSCRVNVRFTPSAMGPRSGTLTVTHDAAGSPEVIALRGAGVEPRVSLNPSSLQFGPQAVDTTSDPQTVTLTNSGTDTLKISKVAASGDFSATSSCPPTLRAGDSCDISVTFTAQSGGPRNGSLTITDDASGSPQQVPLNGTGLGPGVQFDPANLDFGPVTVGSSSQRPVRLTNSGSAALSISDISTSGDFQTSDDCPRGPLTLAAGHSCTITVTFTPSAPGARSASLVVTDNAGDSPQSYGLKGEGAKGTYTIAITTQPRLSDSDGTNWKPVDPLLTLTMKPTGNDTAILSGNADLWTATAGVNQDLGITVGVGGGPDTLLFWKESGGYAGTLSPNAAFVHGSYPMTQGFTYIFKLVWKTNHQAPGATIFAGAGPIGQDFSPTRLTVQLIPADIPSAMITSQPTLTGSDGTNWSDIDPSLTVAFNGSLGTTAVIAANADLWTATPGINQDIGIFVTPPGQQPRLVAWKESGGSAGTYSPNAAFVQAMVPTPAPGSYLVTLKWKTNVNAPGSTIVAGAGPINDRYSPTTLTVQRMNGSAANISLTTRQLTLQGSDGANWAPLGSLTLTQPGSTVNAVAMVGANADLWTDSAGYNQDIGIFLSIDGGAPTLVAWKESGGFAGVFSPNAAFVHAVVPLPAGHTSFTFTLQWKTNRNENGATIAAGAGPISGAFSPTSLTLQVTPN